MSGDLTDFLLARIAEDEHAARAASPGPWVSTTHRHVQTGEPVLFEVHPVATLGGDGGGGVDTMGDAEHVARHDPNRVLAECEAKRRIVGLHTYEWMGPDDAAEKGCEHDYDPWPCPTLRNLASVYADHPDYRDEWRP